MNKKSKSSFVGNRKKTNFIYENYCFRTEDDKFEQYFWKVCSMEIKLDEFIYHSKTTNR
jgi:hypothetical protein